MGGRAGWLPDQAATEGSPPGSEFGRPPRSRLTEAMASRRPSERGADRSAAVGHRQCGGAPDAWV